MCLGTAALSKGGGGPISTNNYSSRAAHTARPQLLRTFACSPVMVAGCWSIVATENPESKNNGSRQRRKEHLKEEIIRQNTESKKEREQLQRSADVNLLKFNAEPS